MYILIFFATEAKTTPEKKKKTKKDKKGKGKKKKGKTEEVAADLLPQEEQEIIYVPVKN